MPLDVFLPSLASTNIGTSGALSWDEALKKLSVTGTVTKVAAAGSTWDAVTMPAATLTLTGATHVTTATGVNLLSLAAPTITDASAVTVDIGATLYVAGPPAAAGSVTLTAPLSLWVDSGITRLDGLVGIGGTASPAAGLEVVTATDTSDGRPASWNNSYLTVGTGGTVGGCVSISYRLSTTTGYVQCIKPGTGNQTLALQNTSSSSGTLLLGSSGTTIGAFGSAGTTKPTVTGAKGSNAALASLLTALSGMGWLTDSTTA